MNLSMLSILLGLGLAAPQVYGLMNPQGLRRAARAFPRSVPLGWALMALGTAWFLFNLNKENISDFAAYKPYLLAGFAMLGVGCCVYAQDYLAVRGLSVVLLLLAKLTIDTARWADTPWRLVLISWAYLWVVAGIWFTTSPWRLRDLLYWATDTDTRIRIGSGVRLAFSLLVIALGLTVFR
jgi:hypothetical protein